MKVSNGTIWRAREPLQALMKEKMPVKTAYQVARLAHKLADEAAAIDKVRTELVERYGQPNGKGAKRVASELVELVDGKEVRTPNPNWEPFVEEFNALMGLETDLALDVERITLPVDVCVTPATLLGLESFITV